MTRSRARTVGLVGLVLLLAAALGVGGYAGARTYRTRATPTPTVTSTPAASAVIAATAAPTTPSAVRAAPLPVRAALARALAPALAQPALGRRVRLQLRDALSGAVLLDRDAAVAAAPASTAKLLTAAAILTVHRPADRLITRVVAGAPGTITLVGSGDPTLSGAAAGRSTPYAGAARLSDLARQVRAQGIRVTRIVVDGSAFSGPSVSPSWAGEDVPSTYGAAITGVLADGGRAAPDDAVRSATPDLDAGRELATALGRPGAAVARGRASAGARTLATVRSAPYSVLVEQMLHESDNVIAECLSREVAIAGGHPGSFLAGAAAVRATLARLGVDPGAGLVDGSGLAERDRVSPATLARLLSLAVSAGRPGLRVVLDALPVAGWSGTLADRYLDGSAPAAGLVRAKTGTLTGVSALAGLVHDRSGRLLAFAVIADRTGATAEAEAALDALIARVARCGCS